jgi:hypothetical protein
MSLDASQNPYAGKSDAWTSDHEGVYGHDLTPNYDQSIMLSPLFQPGEGFHTAGP